MSDTETSYHFHPDLLALLVDAIPALCRGKGDVLQFFRSAGVGDSYTRDLAAQLVASPKTAKKHHMARMVLARLNEKGDAALRERREVLRRVVLFEDFSCCWPDDRLKAQGLVAQIQKLVNMKDSANRIQHELEENRERRRAAAEREARALQAREAEFEAVKSEFFRLFSETNPWRRGKALESVLNRLFKAYGILLREAFTLVGSEGEGVVEQIDGVIELGGDVFLVEMKWWDQRLGPGDVALHMTRVFGRGQVRGLFIAHPGFTDAAVVHCKSFLHMAPFVLCELEELVKVLNERADLTTMLKAKVRATQIDKQPLFRGWTA